MRQLHERQIHLLEKNIKDIKTQIHEIVPGFEMDEMEILMQVNQMYMPINTLKKDKLYYKVAIEASENGKILSEEDLQRIRFEVEVKVDTEYARETNQELGITIDGNTKEFQKTSNQSTKLF